MKVGDTVTLSKNSVFYDKTGGDAYNPFGVKGVICLVEESQQVLPICVEWDRHVDMSGAGEVRLSIRNSYSLNDLVLVEEAK